MNSRVLLLGFLVSSCAFAQSTNSYILIEEVSPSGGRFQFQRDYNDANFVLVNQSYDYQISATAGNHWVRQLPTSDKVLAKIQCDMSSTRSSVQFYAGGAIPSSTPTPTWAPGADSVAISLAAGDAVECRFYNQPGTLPSGCSSDNQCLAGQICLSGSCTFGCNANVPCPSGQTCDINNQCIPTPPTCVLDSDCGSGQICLGGNCTTGCNENVPCPTGQTCNNNNQCVTTTPTGCTLDSQCPSGQICLSGSCTTGCNASVPCPSGQICNLNNQCVITPPQSCTSNTDCANGQICSNDGICAGCTSDNQCAIGQICLIGSCATGCNANVPCPSGQTCNINNQCVTTPPPSCISNSDCANGQVCSNGICTGCTSNDQCSIGQTCNLNTNQCVTTPPPTCSTNSDCSNGQVCLSGICAGCTADSQCASGQSCNLTNNQCMETPPPKAFLTIIKQVETKKKNGTYYDTTFRFMLNVLETCFYITTNKGVGQVGPIVVPLPSIPVTISEAELSGWTQDGSPTCIDQNNRVLAQPLNLTTGQSVTCTFKNKFTPSHAPTK